MLADTAAAGCNKVQLLSHKRHAHDGAHRLYITLGFEAKPKPKASGSTSNRYPRRSPRENTASATDIDDPGEPRKVIGGHDVVGFPRHI